MIVSLRLQNFRSFSDSSFEFESGVNIIIGPNASGKTNLLEGILMAAQGGSYRGHDRELIKNNKPWARVDAITEASNEHQVVIEKDGDKVKKRYQIGGNKYVRLQPHHKIPVVVFEPNQLLYIASSPELRRNLIDNLKEQLDPSFGVARRAYQRALAQRNALLKTNGAKQKLFAWDIRLSELAGVIVKGRTELIEQFNKDLSNTYSNLAGKKHKVELEYTSKLPAENYAAALLKALEARVETDIERGYTGAGPHRDDIGIYINGAAIQSFASRGEIRTLLLAVKIQEALLLEEKYNQKALMLLDDVFGELDSLRRKALTNFLRTHQAFITTTDADVIGKSFAKNSRQISMG